ncbi:MAG: protein translocase subunit SecD [Gammaproteobacteria bacterium]|nr:protein translocase subunit SecD [Gammaproteobacteria bacterium]
MYLLWRIFWIGTVVVCATIYALPNLYAKAPALKISAPGGEITPLRIESFVRKLSGASIEIAGRRYGDDQSLLLLFDDDEQQSRAFEVLQGSLYGEFSVGYVLASMAPEWLRSMNAAPLSLGLDLLGGVHFLLEISGDDVEKNLYESFGASIEDMAAENKLDVRSTRHDASGVFAELTSTDDADILLDLMKKRESEVKCRRYGAGAQSIRCVLTDDAQRELSSNTIRQNISALRNRVDELGVAEPTIQRSGDNRVIVQLPGVQDPARAREILGSTASIDFRMVHGGYSKVSSRRFKERDRGLVELENRVIVSGENIINASAGLDQETGGPVVNIRLNESGASRMSRNTNENVGRPMAVVYKETTYKIGSDGTTRIPRTSEEVINVATIQEPFGLRFQISGLELLESRDLALLLRAGALKAPMVIVEERSVGPTLGKLNVDQGMASVLLALSLVMLFMLVYYRLFGIVANIALLVNSMMIVSVLSALQATLTLPGIAGIVLTIGMSVDANTLVFERIREEARVAGVTLQEAISRGYAKAFGTITDSNLTTFFSALVLFAVSTGSVRGFAITLAIGIATSMFTAIVLSRLITDICYRVFGLKKLYL